MRSRSDQEAAAHKAKHVPIAETAAREQKVRQTAVQGAERKPAEKPTRQIALVLQGGGALGAYQAGVYQGLCEDGIVPEWVIGTSIGAINGAIIAGNPTETRMQKLLKFWAGLASRHTFDDVWSTSFVNGLVESVTTIAQGIPGFFQVNPHAPWGIHLPVGLERASYYATAPL